MTYLIDSVVRQTTILIAALATASGNRASLARVANQVFLDLVGELKQQGVGNKVIADMFGLALRTYHNKVARLSESVTFSGKSLWEAVLGHVRDKGPLTRGEVLHRFRRDDGMVVRGVLKDLVDSGLLLRSGSGDGTRYEPAREDDDDAGGRDPEAALASMVLVAINEHGPIDRDGLLQHLPVGEPVLERVLRKLADDGRLTVEEIDGELHYRCEHYVIGFNDPDGWEAAVFDHYQAMVTAICDKLRRGRAQAVPAESVGGSTYTFDVWPGHPLQDEVLQFLSALRSRARDLRERVDEYNESHAAPGDGTLHITTYVGQGVRTDNGSAEDD
ncbi:MAG: winged helix DNA-binding domain-containing protein [Myxococcales bacterium]|nr:winged helix DNA-binding domain-containing protein [Myxococcales bacterium]